MPRWLVTLAVTACLAAAPVVPAAARASQDAKQDFGQNVADVTFEGAGALAPGANLPSLLRYAGSATDSRAGAREHRKYCHAAMTKWAWW